MQRVILHCDFNSFYASVECRDNPALQDKPVAVVGDVQARHGIVLAKNQAAKQCGVATGEAIWQARNKCPALVTVPAHFDRYLEASRQAQKIYLGFTDQVEPFGLDEAWLDITGSTHLFGTGPQVAEQLRQCIRRQLGLTVSIGVSFNKVFAKLGSDLKKPDAITVIPYDGFKPLVWPLPVGQLLYVGPATTRKLRRIGVTTIGDLAGLPPAVLEGLLGKIGLMLGVFANGMDLTRVSSYVDTAPILSVGNSTTAPRDLQCDTDVKIVLFALCDSVARRLRRHGLTGRTVELAVSHADLSGYAHQTTLPAPVQTADALSRAAFALYRQHHTGQPIRSLGVRAAGLIPLQAGQQLSMLPQARQSARRLCLEQTMDTLRGRYGYQTITRCVTLMDRRLDLNAADEHIIHPVGFLAAKK